MIRLPQQICVRLLADVAAELRPTIAGFADRDTLDKIDRSISEARTAACGEFPSSELQEHSMKATQLTGKLELFSQGLFLDDVDRELPLARLTPDQLSLVRDVADIAARSLRAATDDESKANAECEQGLSWAYDIAERLEDDSLQDRIQSLVEDAVA